MKKGFNNWSEFYQRISLIFHGIIAFSLLPFAWFYLELDSGLGEPVLKDTYLIIFNVLILVGIVLILYFSHQQFTGTLRSLRKSQSVRSKLQVYFDASLRKFIINEFAAVVALIGMVVGQEILFAVVYVFILFIFSLSRPRFDKVTQQLSLSKEEKELLAGSENLPEE